MLSQTKKLSLLFFMILGIALRFYQLDRSLGGGDENQYLLDYGNVSLKHIATTYFFGGHPVFHTLLMRLMIMAFGDENALAIRFPAFISGIACLWMIYQVALQLFNSLFIARLSILIAALCPVHIYYSQIARGYSLIMFFSITMTYAAVQLLDSPKIKWCAVLVFCGVLSVYTVPTNVYFAASLAAWMFFVLLIPRWSQEHHTSGATLGKKAVFTLALFLVMAALAYLLYLPLINQVIAEAGNYHLAHEQETSRLAITRKVPTGTLSLIFPGALIWFLPFLAAGVLFGNTHKSSYRLLPICIFLLPLLVPLLTGVSGYPRNYLYNLPILVIFLAAGISWAGTIMKSYLSFQYGREILAITYAAISLLILVNQHYPSIKMPDGKLYQQKIRDNSQPMDLIIIPDSKHYLYANNVFKQNLKNISLLNKLAGIKIVASDTVRVEDITLPIGQQHEALFKSGTRKDYPLPDGKKLASITTNPAQSLLPEDFEAIATWRIVSGQGQLIKDPSNKLTGLHSIVLREEAGNNLVIETLLPNKLILMQSSYLVFVWTGKTGDSTGKNEVFVPSLAVLNENQEIKYQLNFGKVNDGLQTKVQNLSSSGETNEWPVNAFLTFLPPGEYPFIMQLMASPGQSVTFDGFRLFVVGIDPEK